MIRNTLILLSLLLFEKELLAQIVAPAAYDSATKVNYTRVWQATAPLQNPLALSVPAKSLKEVHEATDYVDGLGRPIQSVVKKGSMATGSTPRDLVTPVLYDGFGRERYAYLQFSANNTGGNTSINDGLFKRNPYQQDSAFNKELYSDENYYYSLAVFEPSPLDRIVENYAPGNNWVGSSGQSLESQRRGIKSKYWINTAVDSVRVWTVTDISGGFGTYSTNGMYAAGQLFKNVTVDEHNKQTIEFVDNAGRVVLKKVQMLADSDTGTGKGHYGWLCTYHIYDYQNQLRAIIQPKGVEILRTNNWNVNYSSDVILRELCFRYEYDARNRLVQKKVPGAGTEYTVYDKKNRPVLKQDSVLRSNHQWLYVQYDELNRKVATGLVTDNSYYNSPGYHWAIADTSEVYPAIGAFTVDTLAKTFYDDYTWLSSQGNPLGSNRNNSWDSHLETPSNSVWPYPQNASVQSNQLNGLVTGTKTKVLGTNSYLYTASFFDEKGRLIQAQGTNITGGVDVTTVQYSWPGQVLRSIIKHEKAGPNAQTSIVLTRTTYDSLLRIVKNEKKISNSKINGGTLPSAWSIINEHEYDDVGQLKKTKLGNNPLEVQSYDYNIRGWLLGMNRSYLKHTSVGGYESRFFGFDLGYDKYTSAAGSGSDFAATQYNGNITGVIWKSSGDGVRRKYDFQYDGANRFGKASFTQNTNQGGGGSWTNAEINFGVNGFDADNNWMMKYDENGNILSMVQSGFKLGDPTGVIDGLHYSYYDNSNKLKRVTDDYNDNNSVLGDFKYDSFSKGPVDYTHNGNGNVVTDGNKKITNIFYNYLNLPDSISVHGKGTVKYTYDASGVKLKKVTKDSAASPVKVVTTLYLVGNYVNDTLQFIETEEGRARPDDSTAIVYDFFVKDHLGNVRMVLTEQKDTSFYPVASLESVSLNTEKLFYSGLDTGRVSRAGILGYPNDTTYTNPNDFIQQLSGNGAKTGAGIVLKVMAGDKFNLRVNSWYKKNGATPESPGDPATELLNALSNGIAGVAAGKATSAQLSGSSIITSNITNFLGDQTYTTGKPKAYVNWMLVDEQFKYDSASSGFDQVGNDEEFKTHTKNELLVGKNGYLYIYVSNVTPNINVFFDNLQVSHLRGPLLEETHYYPFGLVMAGISSKALGFGEPQNKKMYNGIELEKSFDLSIGEATFRTHDPQLGRWWQIDPKPVEGHSPYSAMANNPYKFSDPFGDTTWVYDVSGTFIEMVADGKTNNQTHYIDAAKFKELKAKNTKEGKTNSKKLGSAVRQNSKAFIGRNSLNSLQKIIKDPKNKNLESLFVGKVGENREIIFSQVHVDDEERSHDGLGTPTGADPPNTQYWINKAFSAKEQEGLFMVGHTHTKKKLDLLTQGNKIGDGGPKDRLKLWATPSTGDYHVGNLNRAKIPLLIATEIGISLYSQAEYVNKKYGYQLNKQYQK